MIIALHGHAQSGKNEVGRILVENYGFEQIAYADPIKEMLYALNPWIDKRYRLQDLVDEGGWDRAKQRAEVRRLLQVFGTEVMQGQFGPYVWINLLLDELKAGRNYVITDARFVQEVSVALRNHRWKILRPGVGPVNDHVSDQGLPDELFGHVLQNDGTLEDLRALVAQVFDERL